MKRPFVVIAAFVALFGLTAPVHATIYLDDTWADGTRNNLNLPSDSPWFTSSASNGPLSAAPGYMLMRVTGGSSAMIVTYFITNSTPPIQLNVGDTLTATLKLSFVGVSSLSTNSQGFRIGLFNFSGSTDSRVTNDGSFSSSGLGANTEGYALFGKMYTNFFDDTPIDIRKRVNISDDNLLGSSGDWTSIAKDDLDTNIFNGFNDGTNYVLQMTFYRTNLSTMAVTMTWSNLSNGATLSDSAVDSSATNFYFDGFAYRPQNNTFAPSSNYFKEAKIEVTSVPVPPSIVTQPEDQDVASGATATFTAVANGTLPLYYQWYYNGSTVVTNGIIDFPPAHTATANPTFVTNNVPTSAAGSYSVIVSNDYGSVTSSVAMLYVADLAPSITMQPTNVTVIPGQFATFSIMATGSQPLSYQWYYDTTTSLTNDTATTASLILSNVQPADAGNYSVIVSNPIDGVTSSNAVLTVDTSPSAPVFIWQPASVTVRAGDSASFSAAAVGDQPIGYQWVTNGIPISGATSPTLIFSSAGLTNAGTYTLVASNAVGTTASSNAVLTVASSIPPLPVIPTNQYNILNYGAYGDGVSNNAAAIGAAIADATTTSTGGVVIVPANGTLSTYLSGPIVLTDYIDLQINSNAMLKMLPRFATPTVTNWPSASQPLIDIGGHHDVAITGWGTIDGNAGFGSTNWWQTPTLDETVRPKLINIHNTSSNILVRGVTLQNSPVFHILLKGGNVGVTIDGVTWNTPGNSPNTDGMDLASTNVLVQNCTINVGDDNIEIGGSADAAADITISNCTFGTGHGVSVGSQVNGGGLGVHQVLVSNCWWSGTDNGIRLKSDNAGDGGLVQNLRYLDLSMTNVGYPIVIYSYYNQPFNNVSPTAAAALPITNSVTSTTPIWRNVTISNLTATATTGSGIGGIIWGLPEMLVSNVTLYNVNISAPGETFDVYNAQAIQIINSQLTGPTSTNTLTLYNAGVIVTNSTPNANLVTLGGLAKPGTNNSIAFVNAQAAITDPRMLGTGPITLANSTLTFNPGSVNSSNTPITVTDASTLAFTSGNNTLNGALTGSGPLTLNLPSSTVLTLLGNSSGFGGALAVSNSGTLLVNNTAGSGTGSGMVTVLSTAKLGGTGTIGGPVTVDGTLAPGASPGTLTINGDLVVDNGAVLQYELGTSSDLLSVGGNLTLGGTLNVTDSGGFTNTTYTLFTYGGALTYNGLTVGARPNTSYNYIVDTDTPNLIRLDVLDPFAEWQTQYFGTTNNPAGAPGADPYGKGINNSNQFLVGLVPTNSASVFRVTSVAKSGNNVVVTWKTSGGDPSGNYGTSKTNLLEYATGSANGSYSNNFVSTGITNIISTLGDVTTNATDMGGATNGPTRFYRVRLVP